MSELRWVIVGDNGEIESVGSRPTPLNAYRQPNCMVKKALMKALGWTYD